MWRDYRFYQHSAAHHVEYYFAAKSPEDILQNQQQLYINAFVSRQGGYL